MYLTAEEAKELRKHFFKVLAVCVVLSILIVTAWLGISSYKNNKYFYENAALSLSENDFSKQELVNTFSDVIQEYGKNVNVEKKNLGFVETRSDGEIRYWYLNANNVPNYVLVSPEAYANPTNCILETPSKYGDSKIIVYNK